jgi:AAHS family 4-hydroxybenzoate transporter-like MFS transporter
VDAVPDGHERRLGAFFGQAVAGRCIERFGIIPTMVPAFILGAAATVGLGYSVASVPAASLCIGLVGLFLGIGTAGAIAMAAEIYPTAIRATGVGLSMAVGRFGQVCTPYFAGQMLAVGALPGQIMVSAGVAAVIGGIFALLFKMWLSRRPAPPASELKAAS